MAQLEALLLSRYVKSEGDGIPAILAILLWFYSRFVSTKPLLEIFLYNKINDNDVIENISYNISILYRNYILINFLLDVKFLYLKFI